MTFTCVKCGKLADRDIPTPPPGVTVVYACHECVWDESWDDAPDEPTEADRYYEALEQAALDAETAETSKQLGPAAEARRRIRERET